MKIYHKFFVVVCLLAITSLFCSIENQQEVTEVVVEQKHEVEQVSQGIFKGKTDSRGEVVFENEKVGEIRFNFSDKENNIALDGLNVSYIVREESVVIIAQDPRGEYLPLAQELFYSQLSSRGRGSVSLVSVGKQSVETVFLFLLAINAVNTAKDFIYYYQNAPDFEKGNFVYQDFCADPNSLSSGVRFLVGATAMVLPGPRDLMRRLPQLGDLEDLTWLTAMAEYAAGSLSDEAKASLARIIGSVSGIVRLRVFTVPGLPPLVVTVGWCLEPLDKGDPYSVVRWISYGLKNAEYYPFTKVITGETVGYGTGFANGRDTIATSLFMRYLKERLPSRPECVAYLIPKSSGEPGSYYLKLWSDGWNPPWRWYANESRTLVFDFYLSHQEISTIAYFTPSSEVARYTSLTTKGCP